MIDEALARQEARHQQELATCREDANKRQEEFFVKLAQQRQMSAMMPPTMPPAGSGIISPGSSGIMMMPPMSIVGAAATSTTTTNGAGGLISMPPVLNADAPIISNDGKIYYNSFNVHHCYYLICFRLCRSQSCSSATAVIIVGG